MKRLGLKSFLVLAAVLAVTVTAWAYYTTSGEGASSGTNTSTLTEPVLSQPSAAGGSVPLSWTAATLPGASSFESQITYSVQRNLDGGGWGPAAAACTDISTTSCTDTVSTSGSYAYRVVAKFRTWTATSTDKTVSVTVGGGDTDDPDLETLEMFDTNDNGIADQVKATFDENLEPSTATSPWALANVPSGGSLASVSTSGMVATLVISEGAGAADTAVGSFTVALAEDAAGIRDAAGNESSFAADAPDDKAAPVVTAINRSGSTPTNAASVGFSVNFSEAVENVSASDFATAGTHTGASIQSTVGGSGASYTVTVNTGSGSGTLGLNLNDSNNSIEDVPGNSVEVNTFTGQLYDIDKTAPQLASLEMRDNDVDGKVDRVVATFDGTIASSTDADSWTLANVPSAGTKGILTTSGSTATLLITEGAGAPETAVGGFTVALAQSGSGIRDSLGNESSFSARAPDDKAAPVVTAINATDSSPTNAASVGFSVNFSESVTDIDANDFALATTGSATGTIGAPSGAGASRTVSVGSVAGDGLLGLNLDDNGTIFDAASPANQLGDVGNDNGDFTGQTYDVDRVAPALNSLEMFDTNTNGKIDQVKATFDDNIQSSTATAPWTLANVPSNGALLSVATADNVATLTITEGSGALDTSVGTFTVDLDAASNGIRDALGNQSSFADPETPTDRAKPVVEDLDTADVGGTSGQIQQGDTITIKYSEKLDASTLCSTWDNVGTSEELRTNSTTVTVNNGGASTDSISVTDGACTFHLGTLSLGSTGYVTGTGNAVFAASALADRSRVVWTPATRTLVITVGKRGSGPAGGNGTIATVTSSALTLTPDTNAKDLGGPPANAITGSFATGGVQQF